MFLHVFCMLFVRSMFFPCFWKWLGVKACVLYVFNMIGCHSINFHWFRLTASLALPSVLVCTRT